MTRKPLGKRVSVRVWQNWMRQWAELLQSGMPVLDALALSSELLAPGRQAKLLQAGLARSLKYLQEGQDMQTAFRAAFGLLPMPLEISLICAQASGDLGAALKEQLERWIATSQAQGHLARSLVYPVLVLVLAIGCWMILHQVSKPHLDEGNTAAHGSSGWAEYFMLAGTGFLLITLLLKARKGKPTQAQEAVLPHSAWISSNYFHVIACELQVGLDLVHCLRHRRLPSRKWLGLFDPAETTLGKLNQMALNIQLHLKQGDSLSQAMQRAGAPDFLVRQSQLAEQTGHLAYCFFLAAKVYEIRARESQQRLQNLLPPIVLATAAFTLALACQLTLAPLYGNLTGLA